MNAYSWKSKWSHDQITAMLLEQSQAFWQRDTGIERTQLAEIERAAHSPHAVIISGLRRVGKSTVLAQLAHRIGEAQFYNVYDDSVKRQQIAPKKIYGIDTGLLHSIGFTFSPNTGKLLENLIFLALRSQTKEIYYCASPGGYDVDFYLPETRQLIQVSQNLARPDPRKREIRALTDAMQGLNLTHGTILSDTNEPSIEISGVTITMTSTVEWLIRQEEGREWENFYSITIAS